MSISTITEEMIRRESTAESFRRGEDYLHIGAVTSLTQRGSILCSEVEGSQYTAYHVEVVFGARGVATASCTCPYDWGGWCKHIIATLLTCVRRPERIQNRPEMAEILAGLDREQLQNVLLQIAAREPALADEIELLAGLSLPHAEPENASPPSSSTIRHLAVEPRWARQQVRRILHSLERMRPSDAYWHVGDVVDQVRHVMRTADHLIEAGDGKQALVLLEAITEEYMEGWLNLDDSDGNVGDFFHELGETWAEAILISDLTQEERTHWAKKLTAWQREIEDYGIDEAFDAAQVAALQGWDHASLQQVLRGEVIDGPIWEGGTGWFGDVLTGAMLAILDRQGRHEEYLRLARAEQAHRMHDAMLVRLGRLQEAAENAVRHYAMPDQCLWLACQLHENGDSDAALRVARHGLTLEGSRGALATWLSKLGSSTGDHELALRAAVVACVSDPSLEAYRRVQELAGDQWDQLREKLLTHLRQSQSNLTAGDRIDIFLENDLVDDAIAIAEKDNGYDTVERVIDAVIERRPEWVIKVARGHAERIMEAGQSKYYYHAVSWLERSKAAYGAANRTDEWNEYIKAIRSRHGRKYRLMQLLEHLN